MLRRAPGAVRRLPRLPGRRRGRARARCPRARRRAATAWRSTPTTRPRDASPRRRRARALRAARRPRRTPSSRRSRRALGVGEPRWPGATHDRPRRAPSLPRLPARAVHLLRALRARLRRGPGRLRADRDRPRASPPTSRPASTRASASRPASPAAPAPTPARPTRSPRSPCFRYDRRSLRLHRHHDLRLLRRRLPPRGPRPRRPDRLDQPRRSTAPPNEGHTCLKGRFAHQFSRSRDRLTAPLIREGGGFRIATWEEAITRIASEFGRIKAEHGPDAIAGLASSRATNEDCYAMARLMRAAIGTNNIDNCSRVCHSPTSFALRKSFGLSGATGSFTDIDARRRGDHHRRQPDRGPPGRRRADQAGDAARPAAGHDRPAADRAGRLRRPAPRAAPGHERRGDARPLPRRRAATACSITPSSQRAPRASTRSRSCSRSTRRRPSRRSPACRRPTSRPPRTSTARPANASIMWGLGVTEHLYGSEVVQLICNLALMTGKVGRAGLGAAAAARPEQRPGLLRHGRAARHLHRLPLGRRRGGRAVLRGRPGASRCRARRATRSRRCSTPRSTAT